MKLTFEVFLDGEIGRDARKLRSERAALEEIVELAIEKLIGTRVVSVDLNEVKGMYEHE